jgi:hypothetical protein
MSALEDSVACVSRRISAGRADTAVDTRLVATGYSLNATVMGPRHLSGPVKPMRILVAKPYPC